jgi:hypothetical protein
MDVFWQSLIGATLGTAVGGILVALIAYWLSKNFAALGETYRIVHNIIDDEFTERRQQIRTAFKKQEVNVLANACETDGDTFAVRTKILNLLNYYDAVMHSVDNHGLKHEIIRDAIWPIIKIDHEIYEEFLAAVSECDELKRPMFPRLRKYRYMWG